MRVHHLNCGSFCPLLGFGDRAVSHCLVVETPAHGLVLVDTGIGHAVSESPRTRMTWMNRVTLRPRFSLAESALAQLPALGLAAADVRHIVVTHLDPDHAGGLSDFPAAQVHVHATELASAQARRADPRYTAALWGHGPRWLSYTAEGDTWFDLQAVRPLRGLPADIVLVPLPGHTDGHCGVAVHTDAGWILHAGDAYLDPRERTGKGRVPWTTRLAGRLTATDRRARRENLERLRELDARHGGDIRVMCSHSPDELAAASGRPIAVRVL
jgi:glyoxylase-like metal-dependent hydrolase (beta-lactamase superfamily II)